MKEDKVETFVFQMLTEDSLIRYTTQVARELFLCRFH